MDLQWQRQAELWLKLMGVVNQSAALLVCVNCGRDTFYLEEHQRRARLTIARQISEPQRHSSLLRLLGLLQPEASNGIPLRGWLAGDALWLSAMAPIQSGAELWVELSRRQRIILDRIMDNRHENA